MPRGTALGMVTQLPEKDETSISKMQLLARLDVCMGGRVAEELIFGADQVTSGARSDLQQATALARHMVSRLACRLLSQSIGEVSNQIVDIHHRRIRLVFFQDLFLILINLLMSYNCWQ